MSKHKNKVKKTLKRKQLRSRAKDQEQDCCEVSDNDQSSSLQPVTKDKLLIDQLFQRDIGVLSSRNRQKIGLSKRRKGVTLLSAISKKIPLELEREVETENTDTSIMNKEQVPNAKCVIIDLTADKTDCGFIGKVKDTAKIDTCKPTKKKSNKQNQHNEDCGRKKKKSKTDSSPNNVDGQIINCASFLPPNSLDSDDYIILDNSSDDCDSINITDVEEDNCFEQNSTVSSVEPKKMFLCRKYDNRTVLLMKRQCVVSLRGKSLVQCIRGKVTILGFELHPDHKESSVYCPDSSSLLTMTALNDQAVCDDSHLTDYFELEPELKSFFKEYPTVVIFKPLHCAITGFIAHNEKFKTLFQDFSVSSVNSTSTDIVAVPESVSTAAECWLSDIQNGINSTVAVCGGLNTGKSTTCRFLVNHVLNFVPQIAYLECDLGQTEFTVPGCVSLVLISEPMFGPPFTHQKTCISCVFVGQVSPAGCSEFYVDCLKHVYSAYLNLSSKPPLIINTMGWMKDLGLSLLVDTLRLTRPDYVIQMCNDRLRDIRILPMMTPEYLASSTGIAFKQSNANPVDYKWMKVPLNVNLRSKSHLTFNATSRRELSILAYFGQLFTSKSTALSLRAVTPYRVSWSDIAIHVCDKDVPNSQYLYALNGNVVALCTADPSELIDSGIHNCPKFIRRNAVSECLGFGIVRSVSNEEKTLYIVTPIATSLLQNVNCLTLGTVSIPSCLLTSDEPSACPVPYVDYLQKVPMMNNRKTNQL